MGRHGQMGRNGAGNVFRRATDGGAVTMGRVNRSPKGKTEPAERARPGARVDACGIEGCKEAAKRHISYGKVSAALKDERIAARGRSVGLCRNHWRDFKKATKEERELDRVGW